ncbi:hypothetical protein K6025_03030 [Ehrlichia sp. JZT12]
MLFPHKLKIKAIYYHIDRSDNFKELSCTYKKLITIKRHLYKIKKIPKNIKIFNIKKKKYNQHVLLNNIKRELKLEIKTLLMSTIAHEMDPTQRAGQTISSNIKSAKKFGRGNKARKKNGRKSNILLKLLNFLLNLILPMPPSILNTNLIIQSAIINNLKKRKDKNKTHHSNAPNTKVTCELYSMIANNKNTCISLMR